MMPWTKHVLFFLAKLVIYFFSWVPRWLCLWAGGRIGSLLYFKMRSRRQVALDNLKLVYKDTLSEQAQSRIARANFMHLGAAFLEIAHAAGNPKKLKNFITLEGLEHLHAALAKKKGAVVFGGHLGNFMLMPSLFARLVDLKFLFREPTEPLGAKIYRWVIGRFEIGLIPDNPRHVCAMKSFQHLKKEKPLGILIDQVETGGLYVDFLGHPAGSILGAANMALKTGAAMVPVQCFRKPNSKLVVRIYPEFELMRDGEESARVEDTVARTNALIGTWVLENPEQWFWGHRRWRSWKK
ncbi:hypothetical protein K8S19_09710 [bacterium]|nr:hypothetical protein [bacterium]